MIGLMGAIADEMIGRGGQVIGVIPEALNVSGVAHEGCKEKIVTKTMRERKQMMENLSDGFIALPGGFGTFEEILEIITLKQLSYHSKPIVVLNSSGYFDPILKQFEKSVALGFARKDSTRLYFVAKSAKEAVTYINEYTGYHTFYDKWQTDLAIEE